MSLSLTAGTSYTFRIIATNAVGTAEIGTTTAVIPFTTPGAPTLGAATPGDKTVSVVLSSPGASNGNAITNYQYAIGTTASAPVATSFTPFAPSKTTGPFTIPLASNGILYYIWIGAVNAAGPGALSSTTATGVAPLPTLLIVSRNGAGTTSQTITFSCKYADGTNAVFTNTRLDNLSAGLLFSILELTFNSNTNTWLTETITLESRFVGRGNTFLSVIVAGNTIKSSYFNV